MADSPVTIAWTPTNMITVVLMVALTFALLGFAARLYQQKTAPAEGRATA